MVVGLDMDGRDRRAVGGAGDPPGTGSSNAPGVWQRISALDFVAPFLAAAAGQMLLQAGGTGQSWGWGVIRVMVGVIVALMAGATLSFYFRMYPATIAYKPPNQTAVSIAALEIAGGRAGATFLCTVDGVDEAGKVYHTPLVYVAGDRVRGCVPGLIDQAAASQPEMTFYFLPDQFGLEERIAAQFPGGTFADYHRPNDGQLIMSRYRVTQ